MNRWIANALGVVAFAALALGIWGSFALNRQAMIAVAKWGDAAPGNGQLDKLAAAAAQALPAGGKLDRIADGATTALFAVTAAVQATRATINRPCKGEAGPDACGTLAQVNKTNIKIGDAIVTTQEAERKALPHVTRAMDAFADASYSIDDAARSGQASIDSFDVLLRSKDLGDALHHVSGMADSGDAILADGRKVSDKLTEDYLRPVKWWQWPLKRAGEVWDIGAAAARHAP